MLNTFSFSAGQSIQTNVKLTGNQFHTKKNGNNFLQHTKNTG